MKPLTLKPIDRWNPFKWFRRWRTLQQAHRYARQYASGYGWAWAAYRVELMDFNEVVSYSEIDDSPFNKGAKKAVNDMVTYCGESHPLDPCN